MTATPHVSVVMCVYNGGTTLRETVQSVLSQDGVELELIVIDDGSTDETGKILEDIILSDTRVRVLRQDNMGLTIGLIRGCEMARGRYIARQDVGDLSLGGRLRTQQRALDSDEDLSFVSCWTQVCGPEKEYLSSSKGVGAAPTPTRIISESARYGIVAGPSHHGSVMFRKDRYLQVGGYRPQFYFGQDWDLWFRLGEIGKFQMIEVVLYQACVMPDSLSGRYRNEQQAIAVLSRQMMLRRGRGQPEDDLLQQAQRIRPTDSGPMPASRKAEGLYFIGEQLRRNGDQRAMLYLLEALKAYPVFPKVWLRLLQFSCRRRIRPADQRTID